MSRNVYVDAYVWGTIKGKIFSGGAAELTQALQRVKVKGLYAFAKEVRRRARIRLSVNASMPALVSDYRYAGKLKDAIDYTVDEGAGSVGFEVGRGLPYARIEDQPKEGDGTIIYGNPTMRFFWYKVGRPMRINRGGYVRRHGKNFFTGALTSTIDDMDKIFGRELAKVDGL